MPSKTNEPADFSIIAGNQTMTGKGEVLVDSKQFIWDPVRHDYVPEDEIGYFAMDAYPGIIDVKTQYYILIKPIFDEGKMLTITKKDDTMSNSKPEVYKSVTLSFNDRPTLGEMKDAALVHLIPDDAEIEIDFSEVTFNWSEV